MELSNLKELTIDGVTLNDLYINGILAWKRAALPSAYQQVEWIRAESGVGAYIDTGLKFDRGATVYVCLHIENMTMAQPFGAAENGGRQRFMLSAPYGEQKCFCYHTYNNNYTAYPLDLQTGENLIYFRVKKGDIVFENKSTGKKSNSTLMDDYSMTANLYLLGQNYNGAPRFSGIRKVGFFEFYDNDDVLKCKLIPCYRKSDNVIGMYDIVRNIFLTNAGSGSFTKGANV